VVVVMGLFTQMSPEQYNQACLERREARRDRVEPRVGWIDGVGGPEIRYHRGRLFAWGRDATDDVIGLAGRKTADEMIAEGRSLRESRRSWWQLW
jgi:hypothetical protein